MADDMATDDKDPELDDKVNAKRKRYDRQLRLWGEHGQAAMEDCSICLLNGSATGTETLKNLVLPGIGSFTVVDGADVTISDLGNNFFLEEEQIGKKRAECVTALLQELNEHVSGSYVNEDISEVLAARPDFLNSFTMVIATQMTSQETLKQVSALCAARKLPLLIVHTYGFLGYLRMDLGEHQVRSRPYPPPRTQERAARAFAPAPPAVIPGRDFSYVPRVFHVSTMSLHTFALPSEAFDGDVVVPAAHARTACTRMDARLRAHLTPRVRVPLSSRSLGCVASWQVVESHPANPFPDVRILQPPAALRELIDTQYADLSGLANNVFAHIPWAILLVKAVDQWKAANGGALPTAYKQKKEVRALVEAMRRVDMQADQNIDEAISAVNTALNIPAPSSSIKKILSEARAKLAALVAEGHQAVGIGDGDDSPAASAALSSSRKTQLSFWLMAAATERFVAAEGGGMLPLVGTIPDMTADTSTYVNLQHIYAQQAAADVANVQAYVREICTTEGLNADDLVSSDDLKRFCKNAHSLWSHVYVSAAAEYPLPTGEGGATASSSSLASTLSSALSDESSSQNAGLYLLLRAAHAFRAQRSCWPGGKDDAVEADYPQLKAYLGELVKELGLPPPANGANAPVSDDLIGEFCRWGGAEMHAIASVLGGVASQEAIKAATHQYQPLNNTFIFNGMSGTTATFEL